MEWRVFQTVNASKYFMKFSLCRCGAINVAAVLLYRLVGRREFEGEWSRCRWVGPSHGKAKINTRKGDTMIIRYTRAVLGTAFFVCLLLSGQRTQGQAAFREDRILIRPSVENVVVAAMHTILGTRVLRS